MIRPASWCSSSTLYVSQQRHRMDSNSCSRCWRASMLLPCWTSVQQHCRAGPSMPATVHTLHNLVKLFAISPQHCYSPAHTVDNWPGLMGMIITAAEKELERLSRKRPAENSTVPFVHALRDVMHAAHAGRKTGMLFLGGCEYNA